MSEALLRAVAVLAAVAIAAGPAVVAAVKSWLKSAPVSGPACAASISGKEGLSDAHLVIEIATRLRDRGNVEGATACQKLLEILLRPEAPK